MHVPTRDHTVRHPATVGKDAKHGDTAQAGRSRRARDDPEKKRKIVSQDGIAVVAWPRGIAQLSLVGYDDLTDHASHASHGGCVARGRHTLS